MNMKRIHTGKQNIKIVKKIYVKLFSGNTVQQIKLCCNPLILLSLAFCEFSLFVCGGALNNINVKLRPLWMISHHLRFEFPH